MPKKNRRQAKKSAANDITQIPNEGYDNKQYYDLIISSKIGEKFYVHRYILQQRSAFFENLDMKYLDTINLNYSSEACLIFVTLMYSNSFRDVEITSEHILEVWKLCFQYDIQPYILHCEAELLKTFNIESQEWWLIANQAVQFKSKRVLEKFFEINFVLTPQIVQNLPCKVQKLLFQKWSEARKLQIDPAMANEYNKNTHGQKIKNESTTEHVFFGEKADCDLIITNKEECKFFLHRVVLNMKATTFLKTYVAHTKLPYSTQACTFFFSWFYGQNITNYEGDIIEVLKMSLTYKMAVLNEILETQFMKNNTMTFVELADVWADLEYPVKFLNLFYKLPLNVADIPKLKQEFVSYFLLALFGYGLDKSVFDVRDKENQWYRAILIEKSEQYHKFHFLGWSDIQDEKIFVADLPLRVCYPGARPAKFRHLATQYIVYNFGCAIK